MVKAAGVVSASTMVSRVLGMVRDVVVASYFGTGLAADAFFVAFRIPNLLRRLVAEGALTVAFVPVFTEQLQDKGPEEARRFARAAFTALAIALALICTAGVLGSPLIVRLFAPGFVQIPEKYALTVSLNRIVFPYLFFVGLLALSMGILNSLKHFFAPALAPALLNVGMITGAVLLGQWFERPVFGLAVGVLIGGALQLALQIPFLVQHRISLRPLFDLYMPPVRRVFRLMGPAAFGTAVYQLNIFISTFLASLLPEGSVSFLWYADRLVQLPFALFGVAVATAVLPSMSRLAVEKRHEEWKETLADSLRLVFFFALPSMVGLIVLRVPILSVLFERGNFDRQSVLLSAQALFYYAVGLWAFSGTRILSQAFYSVQDVTTPVKAAFVAFLVNGILSVVLMRPLGHGGLALALSIASAVNMALLILLLRRRYGRLGGRAVLASCSRTAAASIAMGGVLWLIVGLSWGAEGASFAARAGHLLFGVVAGGAIFFLCASLLRSPELGELKGLLRKKTKRAG